MGKPVKALEETLQTMAHICSVDMLTWNDHSNACLSVIEENKRLRSALKNVCKWRDAAELYCQALGKHPAGEERMV